jgi:hypothetical protein
MYDFIIIGGGISGLYTSFKLLQKYPFCKLLLIEKNKLGGRTGQIMYEGIPIVTGAGIGRKKKDKLLLKLLDDFKFPIREFDVTHSYKEPKVDLFYYLRNQYRKQPFKGTFKQFALSILDQKTYQDFLITSGFTDFEHEDVYDTLFLYGFEDNIKNWIGFSVPWKKLVDSLASFITPKRIQINREVIKVLKYKMDFYQLELHTHEILYTKKVIFATTIDTVQRLVPVQKMMYKEIKGQPFLRIYGKFSNNNILVKNMTMVKGPLQKILPIDTSKGIYMISYSDNKYANQLLPYLENTKENRNYLCRLLEKALYLPKNSLHLDSIKSIFWNIGTHYYKPNHKDESRQEFIFKAQRPLKNMFIVGEMISMNQGWVEGALESVEEVFEEL